jgi:hypothetical protein
LSPAELSPGIVGDMGVSFEVVVDVEATADEAPLLGRTLIEWLTVEGVIGASPTGDDDVWGAGYYRPGPNHLVAADPDDPYCLAFAQSGFGRLEVAIGCEVFYPVQGEPGPAVCPLCGYSVVLIDLQTGETTEAWQLFDDALADWHDGGLGTVACPNDGSAIAINEWRWQGSWPIAVGCLGFTFWGWPDLHPDFVGQIGDRLGHRVVTTRGKL